MGLDLIVAADSRSGGQDGLEARAAAKLVGILLPRRRMGKNSSEFAKMALQGSNRPEIGSGRFGTTHMIDLRPQWSPGRL